MHERWLCGGKMSSEERKSRRNNSNERTKWFEKVRSHAYSFAHASPAELCCFQKKAWVEISILHLRKNFGNRNTTGMDYWWNLKARQEYALNWQLYDTLIKSKDKIIKWRKIYSPDFNVDRVNTIVPTCRLRVCEQVGKISISSRKALR